MWKWFVGLIKEILFPIYCVECGREGEWWCEKCLEKIKIIPVRACPVCLAPTERGEACYNCRAVSPLDGVTALFSYEEKNPFAELIRQFKYHFISNTQELWEKIFCQYFLKEQIDGDLSGATIIPVPLHPRRERQRGFNQAAILARAAFYAMTEAGYKDIALGNNNELVRIKFTSQQAKLSGVLRRQNLIGAFSWRGLSSVPENVLLVDDVFTTGATMQECAKILKQAVAKRVWGLAFARG